jgi:signal transduction histidine kinase
MKSLLASALIATTLLSPSLVAAEDRASLDEAKAMSVKAAAYLKENGAEKAFAAFNQPGGAFHDRDLYVFAMDNAGLMKANGASAALIGKDTSSLKDVDGKPFVHEMLTIKDEGWVDYKWRNPQTNMVEMKSAYIIHYADGLVGVGAYKR